MGPSKLAIVTMKNNLRTFRFEARALADVMKRERPCFAALRLTSEDSSQVRERRGPAQCLGCRGKASKGLERLGDSVQGGAVANELPL